MIIMIQCMLILAIVNLIIAVRIVIDKFIVLIVIDVQFRLLRSIVIIILVLIGIECTDSSNRSVRIIWRVIVLVWIILSLLLLLSSLSVVILASQVLCFGGYILSYPEAFSVLRKLIVIAIIVVDYIIVVNIFKWCCVNIIIVIEMMLIPLVFSLCTLLRGMLYRRGVFTKCIIIIVTTITFELISIDWRWLRTLLFISRFDICISCRTWETRDVRGVKPFTIVILAHSV